MVVVKNNKCLVFKNEKIYLFLSVNYDINVFVIFFLVCFKINVILVCIKYIDLYILVFGINSEEIDIRYSNILFKFGRVFVVIFCLILFKCSM